MFRERGWLTPTGYFPKREEYQGNNRHNFHNEYFHFRADNAKRGDFPDSDPDYMTDIPNYNQSKEVRTKTFMVMITYLPNINYPFIECLRKQVCRALKCYMLKVM